jgi:glutathione S-transferase
MITLHHLNNSRSQRILWLLEELGVDYDVVTYHRDTTTNLAPPELKAVHPLGKSPVITDGELTIHETGAIVEYLLLTYGDGRFVPATDSPDYIKYLEWMHYAEGSAMLPLLLRLYTGRLGDVVAPIMPRIDSETENHFSYMNDHMTGREYFVGDELTGADFMMSFPLEAAKLRGLLTPYTSLLTFVDRVQGQPAYLRGLERGGAYSFGPVVT